MVSFSAIRASVLGAVAVQMVGLLLRSPVSGAAWGWKLDKPDGKFTCDGKGNTGIGCPGFGEPGWQYCDDSTFKCKVVPDINHACTGPTELTMTCHKTATPNVKFQPKAGGQCINEGGNGHTKDSFIEWSGAPTCVSTVEASAARRVGPVLAAAAAAVATAAAWVA